MLFENHNQLGSPQLISTVLLEDKPSEENNEKTPLVEEIPSTTSSQITEEFNTLPPSLSDTNSNVNSQDSIDVTNLPTQTETPNKQTDNSVITNNDNNIPVINTLETIENENNKPIEIDQPSVNGKPVESDQISENEKPIEESENDLEVTNNPETLNNVEHITLPSTSNESQDNPTEEPNYESTIANVHSVSDQNQFEQNSGLDDSLTVTTHNPNDSIIDQQVDDDKAEEEVTKPVSDQKPAADVTEIPASVINPSEITQISTIVADEKPLLVDDNGSSFRPSSIDDIISSVNMVKDAVKNSLETSSKFEELEYQTTNGQIDTYQPTVVPFSEDSLPNNEPQTTLSSVQIQTDVVNENLPENPTVTGSSNEVGEVTQIPSLAPSLNADQGVSTDLSTIIPDKQEISSSSNESNNNINVKRPEQTADDKTTEVTTVQYLPTSADQDSTSNGPESLGDSNLPQVNIESNTNLPGIVANDKTPEITTQVLPSLTQQEVLTDDTLVNKPIVDDEKPANTESSNSPVSEVNADKAPTEIPIQDVSGQSSTNPPIVEDIPSDTNVNIVEPSNSPTASKPTPILEDTKLPSQESGNTMQIPFETEKPSSKPSTNTPFAPAYNTQKPPPSYTPIPQSTWTPKPFHQDSTSEASLPDQGFSDEYDDENEAVFGPGTCR